MSESISEKYVIALSNDEPSHFGMTPHVLFRCTYIEKSTDTTSGKEIYTRKKLSPRARDFYVYLKMIAVTGSCWLNRDEIANDLGCSTGIITSLKKELSQPIEQLNNQPLIRIEKFKKRITKEDGIVQSVEHDKIYINNCWGLMNAYMAIHNQVKNNYPLGIVDNPDPESNNDPSPPPKSNNDTGSLGTMSTIDGNNNNSKQEENCKLTDIAADAADDCSYLMKKSVIELAEHATSLKEKAVLELRMIGCEEIFIKELFKRKIDYQRILDAIKYTRKQMERGKVKSNVLGYLRNAIEKSWKWIDR